MIPIILFGEKSDMQISIQLRRILKNYGGYIYVHAGEVFEKAEGTPRFLLYECDERDTLDLDQGIVVFKSKISLLTKNPQLSSGVISVVESENKTALFLLNHTENRAMTCGMSPRDTLTLSSFDDNSASISRQREIQTLSGRSIEAGETTVKFTAPLAEYTLLAAYAVLLLSDAEEEVEIQL